MGNLICGVVLIGIGFTYGGSIFTGDPTLLDWGFDLLGLFLIGKGIFEMVGGGATDSA